MGSELFVISKILEVEEPAPASQKKFYTKPHIVFAVILIISCILISCAHSCSRANMFIGLISFTDTESDSLILRRFVKAKDFTELNDTFLLSRATGNFERQHDTVLVFQFVEGSDQITSSYDYELLIPKTNAVFKISDISEDILYNHSGTYKRGCINPVTSYKLSGQTKSNDNYNDIIYIKK